MGTIKPCVDEKNVGLPLTWLCNTPHNSRVNIYCIYLSTQKDLMKSGLQNVKLLAKYYDQNICKRNVSQSGHALVTLFIYLTFINEIT